MQLCTLEDGRVVRSDWTGEFQDRCDVAVVGLGTAGALALIAAAREGADAVGIEPQSFMGGVGTGGAIHVYYYGSRGGIQAEVDASCEALGATYAPVSTRVGGTQDLYSFHPDAKKLALERLARAAGARILYRSRVIGVFVADGLVAGVQLIGPRGVRNIRSRVVVDASGDAHACAMAGCAYRMGREFDGQPQPYSAPRGMVDPSGRATGANFDAGYVDQRDPVDLSRAICHGHALHLRDRFEETPTRLAYLAPHLGIREGRCIVCEESVTFDDLSGQRPRENTVMQMRSHHDNHSKDWAFESDLAREWTTVCGFWGRTTLAQVPYGALVPKGVDGILVAGRCISLDHDSAQSFRMQRDMQKTGEIAGVAAALAATEDCAVRDVPCATLRTKLQASGCLPAEFEQSPPWLTDAGEIRGGLSSEAPGVAIWSCKLLGDAIVDALRQWVREERSDHLQKHAAYALGLLRNDAALPVLRRIVSERDVTMPQTERRAQPRNRAAMFLLGLLADREAADLLVEVMNASADDFGDFTHAFSALLSIGRAHRDLRERIAGAAGKAVSAPGFRLTLDLQVSGAASQRSVVEDMTQYVRVALWRELTRWGMDPAPHVSLDRSKMTCRDRRMLAAVN